jgi:hypothetical protein
MDSLTIFGLFAVTAMLVTYALEKRSSWFILAFAGACVLGSAYGFLQGAWPFGLVEAVWAIVAARRWWLVFKAVLIRDLRGMLTGFVADELSGHVAVEVHKEAIGAALGGRFARNTDGVAEWALAGGGGPNEG